LHFSPFPSGFLSENGTPLLIGCSLTVSAFFFDEHIPHRSLFLSPNPKGFSPFFSLPLPFARPWLPPLRSSYSPSGLMFPYSAFPRSFGHSFSHPIPLAFPRDGPFFGLFFLSSIFPSLLKAPGLPPNSFLPDGKSFLFPHFLFWAGRNRSGFFFFASVAHELIYFSSISGLLLNSPRL